MSQNGCNSCHEIESESLVGLGDEVRPPDPVHGFSQALQKGGGLTHITAAQDRLTCLQSDNAK